MCGRIALVPPLESRSHNTIVLSSLCVIESHFRFPDEDSYQKQTTSDTKGRIFIPDILKKIWKYYGRFLDFFDFFADPAENSASHLSSLGSATASATQSSSTGGAGSDSGSDSGSEIGSEIGSGASVKAVSSNPSNSSLVMSSSESVRGEGVDESKREVPSCRERIATSQVSVYSRTLASVTKLTTPNKLMHREHTVQCPHHKLLAGL
jgi:hypothetical protein